MRATTGSWVWDHNGPDGRKCPDYFLPMTFDEALDITESNIKAWDRSADGRIRVFATIEGVGTCSDELTKGAKDIAAQYGTFSLMHKASSQEEVASELKVTGHRPVEQHVRDRRARAERLSQPHDGGGILRGRHAGRDRRQGLPEPAGGAQARQGDDPDGQVPGDAREGRDGGARVRPGELGRPQGHVPGDVPRRHPAQGFAPRPRGHHRRGGDRDGDARRRQGNRLGRTIWAP